MTAAAFECAECDACCTNCACLDCGARCCQPCAPFPHEYVARDMLDDEKTRQQKEGA
jgi:hypothetical protein